MKTIFQRINKSELIKFLSVTVIFLMAVFLVRPTLVGGVSTNNADYTENWDGRGTEPENEKCKLVGQGGRTDEGWIHWVFSTKGESTSAELKLGGTGSGTYDPSEPLVAETWHFYTPFFELDGLSATIKLYGGDEGTGGGLVISDYCPEVTLEEKLEVTKTANTSYDRRHQWSIEKLVDNSVFYLKKDGGGDGTATWTVNIGYGGYLDNNFQVSGLIEVKNTGTLSAEIQQITDSLFYIPEDGSPENEASVLVNCNVEFPYTLEIDNTLTCSYSFMFNDKVTGNNRASAHTSEKTYDSQTVNLNWDSALSEFYQTITVHDTSDLLGARALGTVTAPDNAQFTYEHNFNWHDYGDKCVDTQYDNTAIIVETKQSDDASVSIHCPEVTTTPVPTSTPTPGPTATPTPGPTATPTPEPAVEPEPEGEVLGVTTDVLAATGSFSATADMAFRGIFGFTLGFTPYYKLKKSKKH